MCELMLSTKKQENLEFIVYNLTFANSKKEFSTNEILLMLEEKKLEFERNKLENLFKKWMDIGIIYEDLNKYKVAR